MRLVLLLALLVVLLGQIPFNTYGTGRFFEKEIYSASYDELADSLLRGRTEVPLTAIYVEGIRTNGKTVMYFGPFPALPRIVLNAVAPAFWGKWPRLMVLAAALLALVSFLFLWQRIAGRDTPLEQRASWLACLALGFGLGTPVLFLVSCSYIFHEAIIWGLAWSLFTLAAAAALEAERPNYSPRHFAFLGLGAGMAFLARATFGAPLLFLAGCYCIDALLLKRNYRRWRSIVLCAMPVLASLSFYGWYNYDRFGSPFTFGSTRHITTDDYVQRVMKETGVFNVRRIPTALINFFGFPDNNFVRERPFFQLTVPRVLAPKLYPYKRQREGMATLLVTAPWLVLGALVGLCAIILNRRPLQILTAIALTAEVLLVASASYLCQRYIAECLPLLAYLFCHGVGEIFATGIKPLIRRWLVAALFATGLVAIAANFGTTMSWTVEENWAAAPRWRKYLAANYVFVAPLRKPLESPGSTPP